MRKAAVLGAAFTGKSTLVSQLADALRSHGNTVDVVSCVLDGERSDGAQHTKHEAAACVVTGAQWLLADVSLRDQGAPMRQQPLGCLPHFNAADRQQLLGFDALLLTGLDLRHFVQPGSVGADAVVSTAPSRTLQARQDTWLRAALGAANLRFQVVYGQGDLRWQQALAALGRPLPQHVDARVSGQGKWLCERCSDPACERKLFGSLLGAAH